jgi:hypothetical protein
MGCLPKKYAAILLQAVLSQKNQAVFDAIVPSHKELLYLIFGFKDNAMKASVPETEDYENDTAMILDVIFNDSERFSRIFPSMQVFSEMSASSSCSAAIEKAILNNKNCITWLISVEQGLFPGYHTYMLEEGFCERIKLKAEEFGLKIPTTKEYRALQLEIQLAEILADTDKGTMSFEEYEFIFFCNYVSDDSLNKLLERIANDSNEFKRLFRNYANMNKLLYQVDDELRREKIKNTFAAYKPVVLPAAAEVETQVGRGMSVDNPRELAELRDIYYRLQTLTETYLGKSDLDANKKVIFENLKQALEFKDKPSASYRDKINNFKTQLDLSDKKMTSLHRTATWKRYIANVVSILAIFIPAIVRMVSSNSKYDTLRFWQPESKKAIKCAKHIFADHANLLSRNSGI